MLSTLDIAPGFPTIWLVYTRVPTVLCSGTTINNINSENISNVNINNNNSTKGASEPGFYHTRLPLLISVNFIARTKGKKKTTHLITIYQFYILYCFVGIHTHPFILRELYRYHVFSFNSESSSSKTRMSRKSTLPVNYSIAY